MSEKLPPGWKHLRLDELGTVGRGRSRHRPRNDSALYGGPFPFIQTADISRCDVYITSYSQSYNELGLAQSRMWDPGTLCIVNAGENTCETGILTFGACFPDSIIGFIADPSKSDTRFVNYSLRLMKSKLRTVTKGATQDNLSIDKLISFPLAVPAVKVQNRIGSILSTYDDLIENNSKRIKVLEEMARLLYREWFVHLRFPGHKGVKLRGSPAGEAPEGWTAYRLGDVVDELRDAVDPTAIDPTTPYFGLEHLPRRSIALGAWGTAQEVQSTKLRVRVGDILFGKIRPYFHKVGVAPIDAVCSSDAIVMRPKESSHFGTVLCCVSSDDFVAHATQSSQGTKMPRASWDVLRKYPLWLPPPALLQQFNKMIITSVDLIQGLVLKNRCLVAARDLLLPRLLSGELDVSSLPLPPPA